MTEPADDLVRWLRIRERVPWEAVADPRPDEREEVAGARDGAASNTHPSPTTRTPL